MIQIISNFCFSPSFLTLLELKVSQTMSVSLSNSLAQVCLKHWIFNLSLLGLLSSLSILLLHQTDGAWNTLFCFISASSSVLFSFEIKISSQIFSENIFNWRLWAPAPPHYLPLCWPMRGLDHKPLANHRPALPIYAPGGDTMSVPWGSSEWHELRTFRSGATFLSHWVYSQLTVHQL